MSNILNTYPVFESNQVLTSTQLNKLVNYLDQQNRLTRAKLIGMGVVCGLDLSYNAADNELTISEGTGITSEGYLINLGNCVTVKYRPYTLPPGTIYEPFVNASNEQDITLFELLTDEADDGPDVELLSDETFLSNKVVLLFSESFDKDLKSCLGKSCDELGKERILTLRKLLISISDLQKVWNRTNTGKLDAMFPEKYDLPVVNLPRVLFDPTQTHSTNYTAFSQHYANTILTVFDDLFDALIETYDVYRPLFLESYDEQNPFLVNPVNNKIAELRNFLENTDSSFNDYLGIQYVYDLFIDLILAYNEFRTKAFDLMSECSPDMSRFPKHLMLGEALSPPLSLCEQSAYRHYFVQPPVYNLQKLLIQQTISLHNRIVLMLESFDLSRVNGLDNGADETGFAVKITPSSEKRTLLSQRSVPWYYNANLMSSYSKLGRLKDHWNFDISRTCPAEDDGLVLTYDDQSNDQSIAVNKLSTPLFFDIQDYSFFRIEGYINKTVDEALSGINDLKKQFNLPFDTVSLQLDPDTESLDIDYSCGFEDLQEEYHSNRKSLCGIVNDLEVLYKFVVENQDILFDNDDKGDEDEILERINELLDLLRSMCGAMEACVQDFDFINFQSSYKALLEYIIDFFLVEQMLLDEIEISDEDQEEQIPLINGLLQRLFPLAYKIVDLFFFTKFLRIYHAFKRREFYLRKETAVFSNFISKHPGIDHQAGVRKGGTFIMLYNDVEDRQVIADFNLPYLCCGSQQCVPMCDDGSFEFELPPFARPDYAVTTVNHSVEIDVLINDYQPYGNYLSIESETTSEFGGKITQSSEKGPLIFEPNKDFIGTDTFRYLLKNNKTGKTDEANVKVLVKEPDEEESGCYSLQILECWGEKAVIDTHEARKIDIGADDNIYQVLLDDLRRTAGFTEEEISSGVLEEEERRRQLLNCIGIPNDNNTTYDQLAQLILQYQKDNCEGGGSSGPCYTRAILTCWGRKNVLEFLAFINMNPGEDPFNTLLNYLREKQGFADNEISFMLEMQSLFVLLTCIFPNLSDDMDNEQMRQLLLEYQSVNCNGQQGPQRVNVDLKMIPVGDLQKVLVARGVDAEGTEDKKKAEKAIDKSKGGNQFTEDELNLFSKNTLIGVLKKRKIKHTARDSKKDLIHKLM